MNIIKAIKNYGIAYSFDAFLVKVGVKKELSFKSRLTIQKYLKSLPKDCYPPMLKSLFENITGEQLNIENPQSFNEKIQWLKLYDSTPVKTLYADKYRVREIIKNLIGENYLIPTVGGAWFNANEIDFSKLPHQFVLKCNHGSGMNIVVKDKSIINTKAIVEQLNNWLKIDFAFYWHVCNFELHYSDIKPLIFAEKYIQEIDGNLHDYKIHCFDGEPVFIEVISDRNFTTHQAVETWYDINWHKQEFTDGVYPMNNLEVNKPKCLNEMIKIARLLSDKFKYVRIDLYEINGQIYFGEFTFTPGCGTYQWKPQEANILVGKHINIQ